VEVHEVGFEVASAEVAGHIHPHHAPPVSLGHSFAPLFAAAMFAATVATTAPR
jgi:hypothetical protein